MRYLMSALLIVCGGIGALFGILGLTQANGAVQEIEGLIGVLIVAVAGASLYIGAAVDQMRSAPTPYPLPPMAYPPPPPPPAYPPPA